MCKAIYGIVCTAILSLVIGFADNARAADDYTIDPMHSGIGFKISHIGLSWIQGRFNSFSGDFTLDPDNPANSSFSMSIKTDSIDTNNKGRDNHLRSPDFFNAKQFPVVSFKSTAIKPIDGGYEVTGDLTLHGVTKSISFALKGGAKAEFPKGKLRTGFTAEFPVKRDDFGVGKPGNGLGDEVFATVSFEGVKK
ncbi:MAG TPA: YceI family protein [Gemmataceae bacterium]|nr:YceI family protein [Gemmataceae bacterium]